VASTAVNGSMIWSPDEQMSLASSRRDHHWDHRHGRIHRSPPTSQVETRMA
jgi:hypothetical protein